VGQTSTSTLNRQNIFYEELHPSLPSLTSITVKKPPGEVNGDYICSRRSPKPTREEEMLELHFSDPRSMLASSNGPYILCMSLRFVSPLTSMAH
jgi:hypothetical protein